MKEYNLTIDKAKCFDEVAKTTAYVAIKLPVTNGSYDRVAVKDADKYMLERFWQEATDTITEVFTEWIGSPSNVKVTHGSNLADNYEVLLTMPNLWNANVWQSLQNNVQSFVTNLVIAKWLELVHSEEYKIYYEYNTAILQEMQDKIISRIRPTKPTNL